MPRLNSIPLSDLQIRDPFWSRYHSAQLEKGLLSQFDQLEKTGRIRNFMRVANAEAGGFEGLRFNDSDVYKWLEAAAYALLHGDSPELRKAMDETIRCIERAQESDGYINTYFQLTHPDMKWRNLNAMHEMYCGGHLIEAGIAVFECTGDQRLLDVGIRFADHVASLFGPGKRSGSCGHQEIELALIKLSDTTKNQSYRDLAEWMIEERGKRPSPFEQELEDKEAIALAPAAAALMLKDGKYSGEYLQDHLPIREHDAVVGHAVRAMYYYIAAAGIEGDPELTAALERTWTSVTQRRMYVTGGIGPSGDNEGFTSDFDLPNLTAYAETCAAVGLVFWGHSLLQLTGGSEYADVMERALYNGALAGISLDTTHFFYDNPLESRGQHRRTPWFGCACCPPNIARLIGSVGRYAVSISNDTFWVHIPIGLEAAMTLNGVPTIIKIESNYPWSGAITITVEPEKPVNAELRFRIPDWADDVETEIPGLEEEAAFENGYIVVRKTWQQGDVARFNVAMKPRWVISDPRVFENLGRVALAHGPLIYAAEEHDLGFAPQTCTVDTDVELDPIQDSILGGMITITVPAIREAQNLSGQLYTDRDSISYESTKVTYIPYFAWNNRGPNAMQVWLRAT